MKIAYLASRKTLPGSPERLVDAFEHDHMMEALGAAFASAGMEITDISWDDPSANWADFDGAIIGTTWDYWDRHEEFLSALDAIDRETKLFNPAALVRWNIDKTYLRDLEQKGVRLIPTLWLDTANEETVSAGFDTLATDDIVCKRQVGAGADGQHRLKRGDQVPDMPHAMMVQPFLSTIQSEGEYSFIFIDGDLSHVLIKRAADGDYRIQSLYGGKEEAVTPEPEDLAAAEAVIVMLDEAPLYARVDMVRGPDGKLLLMELEMIEPYLYPLQGPDLGARLAAALKKRLA
ncbi:MAG: hypothetical protein V3V03_04555 [Hyphomonadaceae bacterium]